MWDDSKKPTDKQRKNLLRMIHEAFIEIRILGFQGKSQQASDLADAFHNLPVYLEADNFSFDILRRNFIEPYHRKYPERSCFDYLKMLEKIINDENLDNYND